MNKKVEEAWNNAHKIIEEMIMVIPFLNPHMENKVIWDGKLIIDTLYQKEEQIHLRICKQYNGKKIE